MRINNNINAINANRLSQAINTSLDKNLQKLSSGIRINRAADDAANLPISEKMRNQISGLKLAMRNAQDGISMVQTAEGALTEAHSILNRMRNLAVQSSNDILKNDDRDKLNKEFSNLQEELNRIAATTEFNKKKLLDGSLSERGTTFQVDANTGSSQEITMLLPAVTTKNLGIENTNISHRMSSLSAIDELDAAINLVSTTRGTLGSAQAQLEHSINNLGVIAENMASSESRIRDTNMYDEMTSFSKNQIINNSATAVLAQANAKPQNVLKIVR